MTMLSFNQTQTKKLRQSKAEQIAAFHLLIDEYSEAKLHRKGWEAIETDRAEQIKAMYAACPSLMFRSLRYMLTISVQYIEERTQTVRAHKRVTITPIPLQGPEG